MAYKLTIENVVEKYLSSLPRDQRDLFDRKILRLKNNKVGDRCLDKVGNTTMWELKVDVHRVYYTVKEKIITIEAVTYEGNINVTDASHKNKQERTINKILRRMKKERNMQH